MEQELPTTPEENEDIQPSQPQSNMKIKIVEEPKLACFGCRLQCCVTLFAMLQIVCNAALLFVFILIYGVYATLEDDDEVKVAQRQLIPKDWIYERTILYYKRVIAINGLFGLLFGFVLRYGASKKCLRGDTESVHLSAWIFYVTSCWLANFVLLSAYECDEIAVAFSFVYFLTFGVPLRCVCLLIREREEYHESLYGDRYHVKGKVVLGKTLKEYKKEINPDQEATSDAESKTRYITIRQPSWA